jgi:hypothetical protein
MPLSLAKLRLRYQDRIAVKVETASQITLQSPADRSSATMSAAPGASLGIASHVTHLGEIAQDDRWEKHRSGRMMALHRRSRVGPVVCPWTDAPTCRVCRT